MKYMKYTYSEKTKTTTVKEISEKDAFNLLSRTYDAKHFFNKCQFRLKISPWSYIQTEENRLCPAPGFYGLCD